MNKTDFHRARINYIIGYIAKKYGLGNDIFTRGMLKTFTQQVDAQSDSDVEDIWAMLKKATGE